METESLVLLPHHKKLLDDSAIAPEIAKARGYWTATKKSQLKELGFSDAQCRVPALVCPVHSVTGEIALYQIRSDNPRAGRNGKSIKYDTPTGAKMALDIHPSMRQFLGAPTRPLFVTEGIRKADSATSKGLCCIALLGVHNFRGTNDEGGKTILAAWEYIHLKGREVFIVFDSDVMLKPAVHFALARLKAFLESRGALVKVIYLEPRTDGGKVGLDDFFNAGHGTVELLARATDRLKDAPDQQPEFPYKETALGLLWLKPTKDGIMEVPLCNFTARIVADRIEDDGVETKRSFEIEAHQGARIATITLPTEKFFTMSWPVEALGAQAILAPGLSIKDHTRAAIQLLSNDIVEQHIYAHLGWRKINDRWVYLHARGAIGEHGPENGISVSVPSALERYLLPTPLEGETLINGIDQELDFFKIAPAEITVPLFCAIYRAPLGDTDHAIHLAGKTGVGKTELTAIAQQHYGSEMDARHLPASWSSTGNALEGVAFAGKDTVVSIDDFCPIGSTNDIQRFHREADRILRAQGNTAGRLRMRADTMLRPAKPPRCSIVSTGEDTPRGQSLRARLLVVEVEPGDINWPVLSQCQQLAAAGIYAGVMAAYLQWLAPHYEEIKVNLKAEIQELRSVVTQSSNSHKRTADIVANLALGLRWFLAFAHDVRAITDGVREKIWRESWDALLLAGSRQDAVQLDSDPVKRFIELLSSTIASGRAHLANEVGEAPSDPTAWGWEEEWKGNGENQHKQLRPKGERIGWIDEEGLYLNPDASFAVVQKLSRDQSDSLPITQRTLHKRLKEAGYLASQETSRETLLVRRTFEGQRRRILHLRKSLFADALSIEKKPDQPDHHTNGAVTL